MTEADGSGKPPERKISPQEKQKEAELFMKYLETRKIVIADTLAASRSSLFGLFREMGSKPSQLFLANSYQAAEQEVMKQKPHIVIAEYDLGTRCGLELFQTMRAQHPAEMKETIFIIVTSNTSQSAVARSLEEDIDGYIIKPYTMEYVRNTVMKVALEKIHPPQYMTLIEAGKKALIDKNFDEAEVKFREASKLNSAPSLAYFYLGQTSLLREIFSTAEGNYEKGLTFNKIHYKCLVGLYELLMSQQEYEKAYEVVKRLAKYFPANPKRLAEVIRLAIIIGRYEDIERYYNTFVNMSERNETLIKYACAALIVCGKYYLSTKLGNLRAIELFKKAVATSAGRLNILVEVITSLLEYKLIKEAQQFMTKFPPEAFNTNEFLITRFLVTNGSDEISKTIEQGRALLAKGISDERVFKAMIKRSIDAGLDAAADDIMVSAKKAFPDKAAQFDQVFKGAMTERKDKA